MAIAAVCRITVLSYIRYSRCAGRVRYQPVYLFLRYFQPHAHTYGVPFAVKLTLVYPAPNSFTYTKPDTVKSEMNLLI